MSKYKVLSAETYESSHDPKISSKKTVVTYYNAEKFLDQLILDGAIGPERIDDSTIDRALTNRSRQ